MATVVTSPSQAIAAKAHPLAAILIGWHLLSLDAPSVAALWTIFLAHCYGVPLPWTAPAALALAVWLLYAFDRLADTTHLDEALAERHHFHHRRRVAFIWTALGAAPLLLLLLTLLPAALRAAWLLLVIPMTLYVAAVHLFRFRHVPKEHLVAIFFALATAMPVLVSHTPFIAVIPAIAAFGALCWLNCVAICRWECARNMDAATAWSAAHFQHAAVAILLVVALALWPHPVIGGTCAMSVLLLCRLERARPNALLLRALADAALLTPLGILPFLHPQ